MLKSNPFNIIISCSAFVAQALFSQIMLQGTVADNGGEYLGNGAEPVANALVAVTDQSDATRFFSTHTDDQGRYTIHITQTDVQDKPPEYPGDFRLFQNHPNPFNPSTIIGYHLPCPSYVRMEIHDLRGRKVKSLLDGFVSSGTRQIIWDATDDRHRGVPAGLYVYSLRAANVRLSGKMLLVDGHAGAASHSMGQDGSDQIGFKKPMSDRYRLRITGDHIEAHEQSDLVITESAVLDVTVKRTVADIDGNVYRTVKIGGQWWMAENLKVMHYNNRDPIPNVTDDGEWSGLTAGACCHYNNETDSALTWGGLYNWHAVNDSRGIAPVGWHVPTDEEWQALMDCLGGAPAAGGKLKETGTTHWTGPNTSAANESGFTALPGGNRHYSGNYALMGNEANFWTSTETSVDNSWYWKLRYDAAEAKHWSSVKRFGRSIRCVRDH